ncbi:MAG: Fic family protein [Actinobacteria bacterium]|nr:Fic family protein [Actinomycetota bacterium]
MIPGTFQRTIEGYDAFIPHPLPPDLYLPFSTYRLIEDTMHSLGQVERSNALLPNAALLVYSSLQREALASSTIEDTIATPDELVLFQASHIANREAVREVANYSYALEWGVQEIETRPLATNLILGLHERLLAGVRGGQFAGRFKDRINGIGRDSRQDLEDAIIVFSPPQDAPDLVAELERYIHSDNMQPKLMQCALVHYQFETIHPFRDGNGRVGRLLIILQLMHLGLLSAPLIHPSVYFERTRDEYYQRLQEVRTRGAWDEWVEYFVRGIQEQCEETIAFTQEIRDLRARLGREIPHVRRRASLLAALEVFFKVPVLSTKRVSEEARMSVGAARTALNELEELEIVREITGRKKGRVYACDTLLDAIFER